MDAVSIPVSVACCVHGIIIEHITTKSMLLMAGFLDNISN